MPLRPPLSMLLLDCCCDGLLHCRRRVRTRYGRWEHHRAQAGNHLPGRTPAGGSKLHTLVPHLQRALVWGLLCAAVDRLKLRRVKRFLLKTLAVLIFTASTTSVCLAGLFGIYRRFQMFLKPITVFWDESGMKRTAVSNNDSRAVTISQLFAPYFTENLA